MSKENAELDIIITQKMRRILEDQGYAPAKIVEYWSGIRVEGYKNEEGIYLEYDKKENKILVKGIYPRPEIGEWIRPDNPPIIKFTPLKTIEQGIKEMQKRFLTQYREELKKLKERIKEQETNLKAQGDLLRELRSDIGMSDKRFEAEIRPSTRRGNEPYKISEYINNTKAIESYVLETRYGGQRAVINIDINSREAAKKICKLIKELREEKVITDDKN